LHGTVNPALHLNANVAANNSKVPALPLFIAMMNNSRVISSR
jgi:hypothetical protein